MKSTFDPTLFNFVLDARMDFPNVVDEETYITRWRTIPMPDKSPIGKYLIEHSGDDDYWYISEIWIKNGKDETVSIYIGKIPDNNFGFQLLLNMNMLLPVVTRHNKIEDIMS